MNDDLILDDILKLCNGIKEDGSLMAGSSLAVFIQTKDKKPLLKRNAEINVPLEIHCVGGCITIAAEFESKEHSKFINAIKVCNEWLSDTSMDPGLFTLTIVPLLLQAKISLILQNLVYCDFYKKENNKQRLILTFDNNATALLASDDIDYEMIKAQVEKENEQREKELEDQLLTYLDAKKEQDNPIRFDFGMDLDDIKEENVENGPIGNSNVQFGKGDTHDK